MGYNELMCYKQTEINSEGKLKFFLEKHSTKEGTWGKLSLKEGEIDFIFQDGQGQERSRTRLDKNTPPLIIPPASWHKIIPVSVTFNALLEFYCAPHRYFNKKYGVNSVHSDLHSVYQTYLTDLGPLIALDVGCGTGRNLLYLGQLGFSITGVDNNKSVLDSIQDIAQKETMPQISTLLHDLNQPLILESEQFDLVFSTMALQFLHSERVPILLTELQGATKKNGYHFLVFPIKCDLYPLPDSFTYLPPQEELYRFYQDSGWSILEHKESVGYLHKQDEFGRRIPGLFGLLLAQKIG